MKKGVHNVKGAPGVITPRQDSRRVRVSRERRTAEQKCKAYCASLKEAIHRGLRSISKVYQCTLDLPQWSEMDCHELTRIVKSFLVSSDVRRLTRRMGRFEREGCRYSVEMLKKVFPEPCACMRKNLSTEFIERATHPVEGDLPDGFLGFVDREVGRMFPEGWDCQYEVYAATKCMTSSACTEKSRNEGGCASMFSDFEAYSRVVMGKSEVDITSFKYKEVPTAGKLRPLTITPANMAYLRPLHKMIYDRLRRFKWLLVGPPSGAKMEKAGFCFRDEILSGDYAGATDNLDLRVSHQILASILTRCRSTPDTIKALALRSLYPTIEINNTEYTVRRGQMMGSLLSFPLLCLYNRIVSKFALGNCPMLINGDDIIAETKKATRWFDVLPQLGMKPEKSKSGLSKKRLNINSTVFLVKDGSAVEVPTLRLRSLEPKQETAIGIGSQCRVFSQSMTGSLATRATELFLSRKRDLIVKAQLSGITLPQLGFCGIDQYSLLQKLGFTQRDRKSARLCPTVIPLPPLSPLTSGEESFCFHGSMSRELANFVAMTNFANRMESKPELRESSRKLVNAWWKEVDGQRPAPPPELSVKPGLLRFIRRPKRLISRFWGELLPREVFLNRYKALFMNKLKNVKRVPMELFSLCSQRERLHLSGLLWQHQGGDV